MASSDSPQKTAPREVTVPSRGRYQEFERLTDLREPFRISGIILDGTKPELKPLTVPPQPIIAFINARSGGNMGTAVAEELYKALGDTQVFDLSQYRPDKVLRALWANLKRLDHEGDQEAKGVRSKLRILAAGGDGTIAWILKTIQDMQLDPPPAVCIMPLGTGNDLSRQLNWGTAFETSWIRGYKNVRTTLAKVALASEQLLDTWSVKVTIPYRDMYGTKPHSLSETLDGPEKVLLSGMFFNYVSIGLDAKSALGFHSVRENAPALASNRYANMWWYAACSFKAGWFGCSRPLCSKCTLQVQCLPGGEWEELPLDNRVRAVVCLNLQNYGGGVNLWGRGLSNKEKEQGWHEPWICDGLIEVVSFSDGYHTGVVMGTKGNWVHAKRVAQVCGVRMQLRSSLPHQPGDFSHAYLQVDGEPWTQSIPASQNDEPVQLEVSYQGTCKVLYNGDLTMEQKKKNEDGMQLAQLHRQASKRLDLEAEPVLHVRTASAGNGSMSSAQPESS